MDFKHRSYEKEMLDGDDIPFSEIRRNMQELEIINSRLGGHRITIKGFRSLSAGMQNVHICEIGCGGGDNLKAIWRWAKKKGIRLSVTGIDIKQECIDHARDACAEIEDAEWICADYRHAIPVRRPDIVFNSLFCHHFDDEGVRGILEWMHNNSNRGFFVNDLQRHPLAYHGIRVLTSLFSGSELVRNDAPLSVLRGFTRREWEALAKPSQDAHEGLKYTLTYEWAFRWLLIGYKNGYR